MQIKMLILSKILFEIQWKILWRQELICILKRMLISKESIKIITKRTASTTSIIMLIIITTLIIQQMCFMRKTEFSVVLPLLPLTLPRPTSILPRCFRLGNITIKIKTNINCSINETFSTTTQFRREAITEIQFNITIIIILMIIIVIATLIIIFNNKIISLNQTELILRSTMTIRVDQFTPIPEYFLLQV